MGKKTDVAMYSSRCWDVGELQECSQTCHRGPQSAAKEGVNENTELQNGFGNRSYKKDFQKRGLKQEVLKTT